ncbi:MAG TPA: ATP-binding protein [Pyrinomonadaceae bacterium]|nr:ATP-binding protein [Pyrinomonadaceae bacterium]
MPIDPTRTDRPEDDANLISARIPDADVAPYWLSAIIESADDAVISKSLEGIIQSWNRGAEHIFGYTPEEVIGSPITIIIPEELISEEFEILSRIRRGERIEHYETVRMRKDGTRVDISLTVSPIKGPGGKILGASKIARDISERKRADAALKRALREAQEAREETETINRLGQLLSGELDQQRLVQAVTDAATELTGARFGSFFYNVLDESGAWYMLYTLSGVPREAFAHFPMPRNTDLFGPTFRGEGIIRSDDVRQDPRYGRNSPYYGMPEGHLPVVSYLAVPVISRSGDVIGGLFFGHPDPGVFTERHERIVAGIAAQTAITMDNARLFETARREREQAERAALENERLYREAREASRLKDEFLATLSHELRTPLTAILGWSHMLRTGLLEGTSKESVYETIERNARAQAQLIDDLLDVSRIITGKLRLDVRPVDPNSFIEAAVGALGPAADSKGVRVLKLIDAGVVSVVGDPVRLQQVVWNLLSNAIKFTQRGGSVEVRLERVNSHIEIAVSDDGAGIPADFLPYVFDRFRQADQRISRQHGGLGLGLAIVRHLVELHGGTVRAESPGEGRGATFTVQLPIAPFLPEEASEPARPAAAHDTLPSYEGPERLDGVKILVVDDEPDTLEMLRVGLTQCGAEVSAARSAPEALAALDAAVPDVLISDIGMPDEDGYQLVRKIRARPAEQGGRVPAIALTAYARTEDRLQALRAGYHMHVPKPVELAELVAVVSSLVRRGR